VQVALQSGNGQLGVVLVATKGPISQIEVLRAMEYGNVHVSATCLQTGSDSARALVEASTYLDGPSIVLLVDPSAVCDDERWTPFRYDPRRERAGESAFIADSERVRKEIQGFLSRENLLTLVANKSLPAPETEASGNAQPGPG